MLSKAIEYLSFWLVTHQRGNFIAFHSFGVVFGPHQVVSGCFRSFRLLQTTAECFGIKIYRKGVSCYILLQSEENVITMWGSFDLLQSTTGVIKKYGSFFVLQSEASGIAK